eukprot:15459304-Alexandrium_andersonii.AAC.1
MGAWQSPPRGRKGQSFPRLGACAFTISPVIRRLSDALQEDRRLNRSKAELRCDARVRAPFPCLSAPSRLASRAALAPART